MSRRSSQGAARPTSQSSPLPSAEASRGTRRPREDTDPDEGNTGTKRRPWTQAEDEQVIRIVSITDGKRWAEADLLPPGRTAKQCRERYHNHLDPRMNRKEPGLDELVRHIQDPGRRAEGKLTVVIDIAISRKSRAPA